MRKVILGVICLLFITLTSCNSDKCQVRITGSYQKPGGNYVELTTPVLPADVVNLKYDYTLTAKDDKHSVVDCIMKFPKYLNIDLKSMRGVQAIELEDGKANAMLTITEKGGYKYCEFLIPQKDNGTGFVEFQVKNGYLLKGLDIPIEFIFTHYKQPFFKRNLKTIAIAGAVTVGATVTVLTAGTAAPAAAGLVAGAAAVTGGGIAAGVVTATATGIGSVLLANKVAEETIQEIKDEYSGKEMNDSYHVFTLQFR